MKFCFQVVTQKKMCKIRTLADDPTQWICHQPSPHTSMILILNTIHYLLSVALMLAFIWSHL